MCPLDIPDSLSDKLILSTIQPGVVIRFYDPDSSKEKRVIILGIDEESILASYVRINSEINFNVFRTTDQIDCQYKICSDSNEFLDHDSYVDCTNLCKCSLSDIVDYIKIRNEAILGAVKQNDLDSIITLVVQSETSVPSQLRMFGLL